MKFFNPQLISSLALIFEKQTPLKGRHLVIASQNNLEKLKTFLQFKLVNFKWYELPPFPYPKAAYTSKSLQKRLCFQAWAQDPSFSGLFLASPQALLKKTNTNQEFFTLKLGDLFPYHWFQSYRKTQFIEQVGDFSSRSFLIDIFSPVYQTPIRVELLGDQIQSIHLLDSQFKKREQELSKAHICSLNEWNFQSSMRKDICDYLREQEVNLNLSLPKDLYKNFSKGQSYFGFESLLNVLDNQCSLDFFKTKISVYIWDPQKTKEDLITEQKKWQKEHAFFTPQKLFLDWNRIEKKESDSKSQTLEREQQLSTQNKNSNANQLEFSITSISASQQELETTKQISNKNQKDFTEKTQSFFDIQEELKKYSLFTKTQNLKKDFQKLKVKHLIFIGYQIEDLKKLLINKGILETMETDFFENKSVIFIKKQIKESFFYEGDSAYLKIEDFIESQKQNLSYFDSFKKRARALEFSELELGDLLVHRQNGIGEFMGLQSLNLQGKNEDFIVIRYKGGDKLFVPAYKAIEVKKYSRKPSESLSRSLLDRLGNASAWERKKSKATKHIQSLAIELIELYKIRKQKIRTPFLPVKEAIKKFEQDFEWNQTLDQTRAIQDIMLDMDKEYAMDRLLVGDTGFGKTEVALTSALRALANNYQVCFLAPTTVLTLQHFKNFKQRFKNTPYSLALINRFVSNKQKDLIYKKVQQGEINLLIATHSVFNMKLNFKNLGLLVLDEEHRFGVKQKERLFRFRKNLDVLSLSATPIPRTLNMALTGIKDISVISQAPEKRKPVKIFLKSWEDSIEKEIIEACQKEKARRGQVIFIYNRVKSLYQRAEQLSKLLPDFKIAVAHGKSKHLDQVMLDFFQQKYDLLLSTNIVESGMDIPQANTLFIDRVHEMGLSQIYQLKGRVGRSQQQAYCYLLYPEKKRLTVIAQERLKLLEKYAGLGGSFQLALYDLENRGAGSLFGAEQSGHIHSLGEEFYFEILNEHLKHQSEIFIEPEIRFPFSTGIPSQYIPEPRLRLLYYKSLSESIEHTDRLAIKNEILEEFGQLPEELSNLFFLLDVREFCKKKLIKHFKADFKSLTLIFHEECQISSETMMELLKQGQMLSEFSCKLNLKITEKVSELQNKLQEIMSFLS